MFQFLAFQEGKHNMKRDGIPDDKDGEDNGTHYVIGVVDHSVEVTKDITPETPLHSYPINSSTPFLQARDAFGPLW